MNVKTTLGVLSTSLFLLAGCVSDEDSYTQGVWERKSDLNGPARGYACSFTIGNKGYLFGGYGTKVNLKDLWEYDIEGNYWTQCAALPDGVSERHDATAFAVNGRGYITTGRIRGTTTYLKDTWEYNPETDTWTQMDDFPGTACYGALSFTINGYGYAGCGYDGENYLKYFYRFDPTAPTGSQWKAETGYAGTKRLYGTSFVIDNVAYICCGQNNSTLVYDFWKFDGSKWTQLRDISNTSDYEYDDDYAIVRYMPVTFVIDGKGYLVGGSTGSSSYMSDYWIYDPDTDLWSGDSDDEFTAFGGSARTGCCSFSTGTRGFVVAGSSGTTYCDDMWELLPYELEDD